MAIKGVFTFAEWVARLTKGFIKATGKEPDNLAKLKINMEAGQRVKDQSKVVKGNFNPNEKWWEARIPKVTAEKATPIKKFLSDDVATAQIEKLKGDLPFMKRMEILQLLDDIDAGKVYGAFDEVQRKELREAVSRIYTDKPDFASGGIARVGYFKGGKVWKEFIEKLFIKTSNDIRQGKGKWAGLTQDQWIKQHDDLTKMLKKWEGGGKKGLPQGAEQYIGMNDLQVTKAIKDATKKVDKDRLATADELEDAREIVDPTGEAYMVEEGMTVGQLDDMVTEHKAYMADMKSQYMRGDLEKYVKPEVLEESRLLRQKKIDEVLDKAYDEVFYQKPSSGDYKYDADVLSDSIAEQLGKGEFADLSKMYQTDIYNTALKRVTQDMKMKKSLKDVEQKMQLSDFDTKGRKPNASGGIAGQLHLNEDFRVPAFKGLFTGSKGLQALIKRLRGKEKTLFPKFPKQDKKLMKTIMPRETETIKSLNIQQLENLLNALKNDKKMIAQLEANKAMKDPGLDFLMGKMNETGLMPKNLGKYTDIDKDIMVVEQMLKNRTMKDRKLHAYGGIAGPLHLYDGGRARFDKGKKVDLSKRKFLKGTGATLGVLSMLPFVGKFFKAAKPISKAVAPAAEVVTRGADGIPNYVYDLIKVVKAKGTKEIVENFHHPRFKYDNVYTYKGVEVAEDAGGNIKIKSDKSGVATDASTGKTHEGIAQENHMQIEKGQMSVKDEGLETQKAFQEPDEYFEGTVYPDRDGKMKDVVDGLDKEVHEYFKSIADESLIKKAEGGRVDLSKGGLAHVLGV